jgi:hypothetical protein
MRALSIPAKHMEKAAGRLSFCHQFRIYFETSSLARSLTYNFDG